MKNDGLFSAISFLSVAVYISGMGLCPKPRFFSCAPKKTNQKKGAL